MPRLGWFALIAGLYLTARGYHSFDGDQAYRLPILLHAQDPALYALDPFVRAFDAFNPHRGYLAIVGAAARPFGLAAGLLALFAATWIVLARSVDRLARATWPEFGPSVGLVALAMFLTAKAGNVGTNHLFESTLLDRLVAFALGWWAISAVVLDPRRGRWVAPLALLMATLVHPSVGLQVALTLSAASVAWGVFGRRSGVSIPSALVLPALLGLSVVPGLLLNASDPAKLFAGMPPDEFRAWAVEVQGPQHMLPHTWRMPQWLAWACYPALAALAIFDRPKADPATEPAPHLGRTRLSILIAVSLASLLAAWVAVEVVRDLRVTLFQPFRMATLARGLCLAAISGRVVELWRRGDWPARGRATLMVVGLSGDWSMVVVAMVEAGSALAARLGGPGPSAGAFAVGLGQGVGFLWRHDTESGHWPILLALGAVTLGSLWAKARPIGWNRRRVALAILLAWALPASALVSGASGPSAAEDGSIRRALVDRCRFAEVAVDPVERLGVWCRSNLPVGATFVGPPGEKSFRLWSRRSVAFNRAGSPYHAEGLRDWSDRYRDHVGFAGTPAEFARAYLAGRHRLEAGFDAMPWPDKAALARRQGAGYLLVRLEQKRPAPDRPDPALSLVRADGGYAIYRVGGSAMPTF